MEGLLQAGSSYFYYKFTGRWSYIFVMGMVIHSSHIHYLYV
ncbi:hypothetical protein V6Z11_D10G246200 [Gossypium hirsutum]